MINQQLNKRLSDYEVNPPSGVWFALEKELDQLPQYNLQERLADYKEVPPSALWNKIDQTLSKQASEIKHTIPFNKVWLRYAAAAAILISVAVSIRMFVTNDHDTNLASYKTTESSKKRSTPKVEEPKNISAAPNSSNHTKAPENIDIEKQTATSNNNTKSAKRYLTFAKENGQTVRLSKKVFPVFNCADKATASVQKRCKEDIESLQQKMANSLTAPTTDFAGLIDMIKTLEEND
jgi:hypothetical protein